MVHEKYIKKGGKTFGPYLYETKRVNGKVVTSYVGRPGKNGKANKGKRKLTYFVPTVIVLLVIAGLFIVFSLVPGNFEDMPVVDDDIDVLLSPHEEHAWLIPIIDAEHLDVNREVVENIFDSVSELDGVFSGSVGEGEYVRIVFPVGLRNGNDHTVHVEIVSGNPGIEIYEKDSGVKIAEFAPGSLIEGEANKVLLSGLVSEEQDSFDLKVVSGELRFDYIVDPIRLHDSALSCAPDPLYVPSNPPSEPDQTLCSMSYSGELFDQPGGFPVQATFNLWLSDDGTQIPLGCSHAIPPEVGVVSARCVDTDDCATPGVPNAALTSCDDTDQDGFLDIAPDGSITCTFSQIPAATDFEWVLQACPQNVVGSLNDISSGGRPSNVANEVNLDAVYLDLEIIIPDTTPPTMQYVAPTPADGTYMQGDSIPVSVQADDSGSGLADITITLNGFPPQQQTYPPSPPTSSDTFNVVFDNGGAGLADGSYTYSATSTDNSGNLASLPERDVVLDNAPPVIVLTSETPVSPAVYSPGATYTFSADATDDWSLATGTLTFDGTDYTDTPAVGTLGYTYSFNVNNLDAGTYDFSWVVEDSAGNAVSEPVAQYVVNPAPGVVEVLLEGVAADYTAEFGSVVGYDVQVLEGSASADVLVDSVSVGSASPPSPAGDFSGTVDTNSYSVGDSIVVEGDLPASTNYLADNTQRIITIEDTTNPGVVISYPVQGNLYTNPVTNLEFTASDLDLETCWYSTDGGATTATVPCVSGVALNFPVNDPALTSGSYTWQVWARDFSGNIGSAMVNFDVDYNNPPVVEDISDIPNQQIVEGSVNNVAFTVDVFDLEGFGDITNVDAVFAPPTDSLTRFNPACVFSSVIDPNRARYSCVVDIWYFDEPGQWSVDANAIDTESQNSAPYSENFILLETVAFDFSPIELVWSSISAGQEDLMSDESLVMNNIGNGDVAIGNIVITAMDLLGVSDNSYLIPAESFSAANVNACDVGPILQEGVPVAVPNALLPRGNNSINNGDESSGQEMIYACLEQAPFGIISQSYSASGANEWDLDVL